MTSDLKEYIMDVIEQAEEKLAIRMKEEAEDRQYDAVAELASVSQQLLDLIQSVDLAEQGRDQDDPDVPDHVALDTGEAGAGASTGPSPDPDDREQGPGKEYPRFVRYGDRLIKVGRSRTSSSKEYRHRAPKSTVRAVAAALRDLADRRESRAAFDPDFHHGLPAAHEFSVNRLMPVRDASGAEVPHYQVSLIVSWLQALGAVRKSGRGRYVVVPGCLSAAELEQHWHLLDVDATADGEVSDG